MRRHAFTLIELAIVLAIIGLVIGGSFKLLKSQREKQRITKAKEDVEAAKNAVLGNAVINGNTLPDAAFFDQNLSPVTDQNHQLLYAYENNLTTNNACTVQHTALSVIKPDGATVSDVAFVVVSESANYNMQTALSGSTVTLHGPKDQVDDNTTPINRVEFYDDVYQWVTLSELQKHADCSAHQLQIVTANTLPSDVNSSTSYLGGKKVAVIADGGFKFPDSDGDGIGDYDWCVETKDSGINIDRNTTTPNVSIQNCSTGYTRATYIVVYTDNPQVIGPGSYYFRLRVKDKANSTATKYFGIIINTVP